MLSDDYVQFEYKSKPGIHIHDPIRFIKKHKDAKTPTKAHENDCCYDLYSVEDVLIKPMERKLIDTGIVTEMPDFVEGQIRPRSGLAYKHGITVLNGPGTIDSPFRNTWKVLLINLSEEDYKVSVGDRIAQVKFSAVFHVTLEEVEEVEETDRGEGGFGSTGR